jgi:hypothetical protein
VALHQPRRLLLLPHDHPFPEVEGRSPLARRRQRVVDRRRWPVVGVVLDRRRRRRGEEADAGAVRGTAAGGVVALCSLVAPRTTSGGAAERQRQLQLRPVVFLVGADDVLVGRELQVQRAPRLLVPPAGARRLPSTPAAQVAHHQLPLDAVQPMQLMDL